MQLGIGLGLDARDIYFFGDTNGGCGTGSDIMMCQLLTGGTFALVRATAGTSACWPVTAPAVGGSDP